MNEQKVHLWVEIVIPVPRETEKDPVQEAKERLDEALFEYDARIDVQVRYGLQIPD